MDRRGLLKATGTALGVFGGAQLVGTGSRTRRRAAGRS